jgi:hypothetical protein
MITTVVNGTLLDSTGTARANIVISFQPVLVDSTGQAPSQQQRPLSVSSDSKLLSRIVKSVTTDGSGVFSITLIANSDILPIGTKYLVTFSDVPQDTTLITVPDAGPVNLEDLLV